MKTRLYLAWFALTCALLFVGTAKAFDGHLLGDPDRESIASRSVGFGVNATTGNFFYSTVDCTLPGTEVPFVFSRSFNSQASSTDSFGNTLPSPFANHRWTHSYNVTLSINGSGDQAEVYWGDGHRDGFIKISGIWQPATPGNFNSLQFVGTPDVSWRIVTRDRVTYQFDSFSPYMRLKRIVTRSGHQLNIHYSASNQLQFIADTHGRTITFGYSSGRLSVLSLVDGRSCSFSYESGEFRAFMDMRGKAWSYDYDAARISRIYEGGATFGSSAGVIIENKYSGTRIMEQRTGYLLGNTEKFYDFNWNDTDFRLEYTMPDQTLAHFYRDSSGRLKEVEQLSVSGTPSYTINYASTSGTIPESIRVANTNDFRGQTTSFLNFEGLLPKTVSFADGRSVVTTLQDNDFYDPASVVSVAKGSTRYEDFHPLYNKPQRIVIEQPAAVQTFTPTIQYNLTYYGGSQGGLVRVVENNDSTTGYGHALYTYKAGTSLPETVTHFLDPVDPTKKLVYSYEYDWAGRMTCETDYRGTKTYFYFDDNDNVTDVISGGTWTTAPDKDTTPATSTIAHVRYEYDNANRRTRTLDHYGSTKQRNQKFEFSNIHLQLVRTFDHNDTREVEINQFSDELRPFRIQTPGREREDQFHQSPDKTKTVEFLNVRHNQAFSNNADYQFIRRKAFDAQGNLLSVGYATGMTDRTDPLSDVTTNQVLLRMQYDEISRITNLTTTLELGGESPTVVRNIGYNYDDDGRKVTVSYPGDLLGAQKIYEFDAGGGLYRVTEKDNAKTLVAKTYRDPAGRTRKVVDPSGFETTYTYNGIGDLLTKNEPHVGETSWAYDYANGIIVESLSSGYKFRRTFNRLGQLTKVESTDNNFSTILNTFTFSYDEAGNIAGETWIGQGGSGSRSFTWNVYGELTGLTDPTGVAITYNRDPETGDLTSIAFLGYELNYSYNVYGQPKGLEARLNGTLLGTFSFAYESVHGSLSVCDFPNGLQAFRLYNSQNELTDLSTRLDGQPNILDYDLHRNGRGLVSSIDVNAQPLAPRFFDSSDPLTRSPTTDLLQQFDGHTVSHDLNGNLRSVVDLGIGPFTYDEFNRYTGKTGTVIHRLDTASNRVSTTRGGVTTRYLTDLSGPLPNILATMDGSNNPTEVFLYGPGGLIGSVKDGVIRCVHSDTNANVVALTDGSANVIRSYAYSPFGSLVDRDGAKDFPFRFAGGVGCYTDPEVIVSMRARVYHPRFRQFLSPDPFPGYFSRPQSLQKYAYVEGQVLAMNDPSGMVTEGASKMEMLTEAFLEAPFVEDVRGLWKFTEKQTYDEGVAHGATSGLFIGTGLSGFAEGTAGQSINVNPDGSYTVTDASSFWQRSGNFLKFGLAASPVGRVKIGRATVAPRSVESNLVNGRNLARQLTSEEQMARAMAGEGETIIGAGTSKPLWKSTAEKLARDHGGLPADWAKMRSSSSAAHGVTTPAGNNFEIHWYQNTRTGQAVEFKTKILGH